ncbi:MarR family winged helix-turn-helix transcriptional regulator [Jannaschia sp. R86511]|uniref:MarR family winged helix-turn-helix transcriptional regulator n=1 Tax=Jannaschia sp. R86511 TaxID=3093853 RepID=UPI0036D3A06F
MVRSTSASRPPASEAEGHPDALVGACAAQAEPGDLGWALAVLLRAHARSADRVLQDLPGGARAFRLLSAVEQGQPNQLALAQASGLDKTVVTYLLDDLAGAGLIERRPDPNDRRARRIVLTPAGVERLADFHTRLDRVEDHLFDGLPAAEVTELRRLLQRAAGRVREHDPTTCAHVAALAADLPG